MVSTQNPRPRWRSAVLPGWAEGVSPSRTLPGAARPTPCHTPTCASPPPPPCWPALIHNIKTLLHVRASAIGTYASRFHIGILQYHEVIIKTSLTSSGTFKNRGHFALSGNRAISKRRTFLRCICVIRRCTFREQKYSSPSSVPSPT